MSNETWKENQFGLTYIPGAVLYKLIKPFGRYYQLSRALDMLTFVPTDVSSSVSIPVGRTRDTK